MQSNYDIEVILPSKFSPTDPNQQELVKWLTSDAMLLIGNQYEQAKNKVIRVLSDTPAIHMS